MADNQLDIYIRLISEQTGEKPEVVLRKIKAEAQAANGEFQKGAEKSTIKTAEWKRSLQMLSNEFGVVGKVAAFIFNPLVGLTAALSVGIRAVKQSTEEYNIALEQARQGVGDLAGEIAKMERERIRQDEAFKASIKQLDEGLQLRIRRVHEEKAALDTLAQAREQFELSQAGSDEQKAEIRSRYAGMRAGFGTDAMAREINLRAENVAALQSLMAARGAEAQKLAGGIPPDKLAALVADLPKQIADARELEKKFGADAKLSWSDRIMASTSVIFDPETAEAIAGKGFSAARGSVKAGQFAQAAAGKLSQFERALAADRAVQELQTRIGSESQQLDALRGELGLRQATQGQVGALDRASRAGGTGRMLMDAASGADAIMGGGRASSAQAAAINAAQKALGLSNQQAETVLRILSALNDRQETFENALKQIEARQSGARNR